MWGWKFIWMDDVCLLSTKIHSHQFHSKTKTMCVDEFWSAMFVLTIYFPFNSAKFSIIILDYSEFSRKSYFLLEKIIFQIFSESKKMWEISWDHLPLFMKKMASVSVSVCYSMGIKERACTWPSCIMSTTKQNQCHSIEFGYMPQNVGNKERFFRLA